MKLFFSLLLIPFITEAAFFNWKIDASGPINKSITFTPQVIEIENWKCNFNAPDGFKDTSGDYQESLNFICSLKNNPDVKISGNPFCVKIKRTGNIVGAASYGINFNIGLRKNKSESITIKCEE